MMGSFLSPILYGRLERQLVIIGFRYIVELFARIFKQFFELLTLFLFLLVNLTSN